jgi:hypothetical protein
MYKIGNQIYFSTLWCQTQGKEVYLGVFDDVAEIKWNSLTWQI